MNPLMASIVVLAQRSSWQSLGNRFSGDALKWQASDFIGLGLLFGGFIGLFWLLSRLSKWQEQRSRHDRPKSPFAELALMHGLKRRERALCREVAKELKYAEPAELFVRTEARAALARRDAGLAERLYREA